MKNLKRMIAMGMTVATVMGASLTSLAAPAFIPDPGDTSEITSDKMDVPMYGYIGDDAIVGPGGKPINVSIPTTLVWGAFSTKTIAGATPLESPEYKIVNNNLKTGEDVKVEILGITTNTVIASTTAQTWASLSLDFKDSGSSNIDKLNTTGLFLQTYGSADVVNKHVLGNLKATEDWKFKIAGTYTGDMPTIGYDNPDYTVQFKFSGV